MTIIQLVTSLKLLLLGAFLGKTDPEDWLLPLNAIFKIIQVILKILLMAWMNFFVSWFETTCLEKQKNRNSTWPKINGKVLSLLRSSLQFLKISMTSSTWRLSKVFSFHSRSVARVFLVKPTQFFPKTIIIKFVEFRFCWIGVCCCRFAVVTSRLQEDTKSFPFSFLRHYLSYWSVSLSS